MLKQNTTPIFQAIMYLLLLLSYQSKGAEFIVTSNLDLPPAGTIDEVSPGVFTVQTLRTAIALANDENTFPGPDLITFDIQVTSSMQQSTAGNPNEITLGLTGDQFNFQNQSSPSAFGIDSTITIDGATDMTQTIRLSALGLRHFQVNSGGKLRLYNLALNDGETPLNSAGRGGAVVVQNSGQLEIIDCSFTFNNAVNGGAVAIQSGAAASSITDSQFNFNQSTDEIPFTENGSGGAIFAANNMALLSLVNNSFLLNQADANGGAVYVDGQVNMDRNEVFDNEADLAGGGIFIDSLAAVTITNSIIYDNQSSENGGGISVNSTMTTQLVNSTLTNNRTGNGSIMALTGGAPPVSGGGVFTSSGGAILLHNNIISDNLDNGSSGDVAATVDSNSSHNLIGVDAALLNISNGNNGNLIGTASQPLDAMLEFSPLMRISGLAKNSPAIDAGNDQQVNNYGLNTDYRGPGFMRISGPASDMGAFETDYIFFDDFEDNSQ